MADGADATTRRTSVRAAARHGRPGLKAPWRRGGHSAPGRRGLRLFLAAWAFLALGATAGTVRYVNTSNPTPAAPFETWATASNTVQAAIDVAADGDEVWVAAGTHAETLTLASGVALYGGFTGVETDLGQRNWTLNQTILDARQLGRVITVATAANERTRIDGFTITGGYAVDHGGGICAVGTATAEPTRVRVLNNHVTGNTATIYGGGLFVRYAAATSLVNNTVSLNIANSGGGLYLRESGASVLVERNTFEENTATGTQGYGGGVELYVCPADVLVGNVIRLNAAITGGGIFVASSSPTLTGNTIEDNTASTRGGGVYVQTSTGSTLNGNVVRRNQAPSGGGVYISGCAPTLDGNAIEGNSATDGGGLYLYNASPLVEGNTISGNTGTSGGGLCLTGSAPTLAGNVICENTSTREGGGFFLHASSPVLDSNTIIDNTGLTGGGMFLRANSLPTLTENLISGNRTTAGHGAGLDICDSSPTLTGNTIRANVSVYRGGGIRLYNASPVLTGNTIEGNSAGWTGGGLFLEAASAPTLNGNTVRGNTSAKEGGGVLCAAGCSMALTGNVFSDNQARTLGGSIYLTAASIASSADTFTGNTASEGGAIYASALSSLTLSGTTIAGNSVSAHGAGARIINSQVDIAGAAIADNTAGAYGGAFHVDGASTLTVSNALLNGNVAKAYGSVVFTGGSSTVTTFVNCTLAHNTNDPSAFASGGAVFIYRGKAVLRNSVIAFNSAGIWRCGWGAATGEYTYLEMSRCCVYGNAAFNVRLESPPYNQAYPAGSLDYMTANPLFADAAAGNWRLTNVSPCVNAGSNEFVEAGATDADGLSRIVPVGGTVDMGAYELRDAPPVAVAQSITLPEDGAAAVTLTAWDVDDDPLTYTIVAGPAHGTLSGSPPNLVYTPDPNYFGSDQVTFQAHDGTAPSTAAAVTLTVTPVNDAPEVVGLWVPAVHEGGETTLTAALGDVDDHSLVVIVTWGDGSNAETFTAGTGTFAATHLYAASGTFTVGVQVRDAAGLSATASASVMVANVAPSVTLGGGGTLSEGDAFAGSGSFADPGADTWSATVDYGDGSGSQALELHGSGFLLEHAYVDQGTYAVTVTVTDSDGDSGSATATVVVLNAAPSVTAGSCGALNEGDTFVTSGSFTDPGVNDTWSATVDYGDGSGVQELALDGCAFLLGHTYLNQGIYTVTVTVADDDGGSGSDVIVVDVANVTPVIGSVQAPMEPLAVGLLVEASATFFDPGMLDEHTAMWTWGDGETSTGTVWPQGEGQYLVTGEHVYQTPGVYTVTLDVLDDSDTSADDDFRYVVIYDAEGGFVTGGGWILSPEGAFAPDPTLTGKATFGFVAKYKKGQQIPSGQTQFDFAVAGLSFHSTAYAWLVVAGPHSKYKGTGTLNGSAGFGFMLTATDGQRSGGGGVDQFRIKIWDEVTGEVVYDNQMGADEDSAAATALGGGSIVIHSN